MKGKRIQSNHSKNFATVRCPKGRNASEWRVVDCSRVASSRGERLISRPETRKNENEHEIDIDRRRTKKKEESGKSDSHSHEREEESDKEDVERKKARGRETMTIVDQISMGGSGCST